MAELFPDVSLFEDDLLETEDLDARFRAERHEINQREEELLRQQALAGQVSTEPVQPGRAADLAVDQPTGPEEEGPGLPPPRGASQGREGSRQVVRAARRAEVPG